MQRAELLERFYALRAYQDALSRDGWIAGIGRDDYRDGRHRAWGMLLNTTTHNPYHIRLKWASGRWRVTSLGLEKYRTQNELEDKMGQPPDLLPLRLAQKPRKILTVLDRAEAARLKPGAERRCTGIRRKNARSAIRTCRKIWAVCAEAIDHPPAPGRPVQGVAMPICELSLGQGHLQYDSPLSYRMGVTASCVVYPERKGLYFENHGVDRVKYDARDSWETSHGWPEWVTKKSPVVEQFIAQFQQWDFQFEVVQHGIWDDDSYELWQKEVDKESLDDKGGHQRMTSDLDLI